ncbi:MAG: hypothetical protein WAN65_02355 [Candidatus Sulfotelmatobacter sp.]
MTLTNRCDWEAFLRSNNNPVCVEKIYKYQYKFERINIDLLQADIIA